MTGLNDSLYAIVLSLIGRIADLTQSRRRVVLCFHSVYADGNAADFESSLAIRRSFLERMIIDVRARGVTFVSLGEALERVRSKNEAPFVALTFDDGYRDNFDVAYPVMLKYEVPFAIFVTTGLVDRLMPMWWHVLEKIIEERKEIIFQGVVITTKSRVEKIVAYSSCDKAFRAMSRDEVKVNCAAFIEQNASESDVQRAYDLALDWDMIKKMAASGLATIGAHTISHPVLSRLSEIELRNEIQGSRERLFTAAEVNAQFFAYPFGQDHEVGALAPRVAAESGYTAAFTTKSTPFEFENVSDLYALPRILIARKAQKEAIIRAYLSGIPRHLSQQVRRQAAMQFKRTLSNGSINR